jgi:tetratricopeptide (TPR) repeat protein
MAGWARGQAMLARAHNRLGEHERARAVAREALRSRSEADLGFLSMYLHAELELALADAACGDFEAALAACDRLLARHAAAGPLVLGTLHETRALVALIANDLEACRADTEQTRRFWLPTESASLREACDRLFERLSAAERSGQRLSARANVAFGNDDQLVTRMRLVLTHTEGTVERQVQRGLHMMLEHTGAQHGIIVSESAGVISSDPSADPPRELLDWAWERLRGGDLEQTVITRADESPWESNVLAIGEMTYCAFLLRSEAHAIDPSGALVLGFRDEPHAPGADVLTMLAHHLDGERRKN